MHSTIWGRPAGSQGRPLTSCEKGGLREGPLPSPGRGAILNWRGGGRKAAPHACVSRASWGPSSRTAYSRNPICRFD